MSRQKVTPITEKAQLQSLPTDIPQREKGGCPEWHLMSARQPGRRSSRGLRRLSPGHSPEVDRLSRVAEEHEGGPVVRRDGRLPARWRAARTLIAVNASGVPCPSASTPSARLRS